jgi:DNA-binding MarR family transcriptional regulator
LRWGAELRPEELAILKRVSGLPVNVPAMAVVTNIWRASQALKSTAERTLLREFNLSWASFSTLYIVWIWGPIETRAIATSQGVTRATVSSAVDTLERRGFVRRLANEADRRLVLVGLTAEGLACIEQVYPRFNREIEAGIVAGLSKEEQAELARLLRVVLDATGAIDGAHGAARREHADESAGESRNLVGPGSR